MPSKGIYLYGIAILLLLPFVLTSPKFKSNSKASCGSNSRGRGRGRGGRGDDDDNGTCEEPSCNEWENNRYRSPSGICNNLENPLWGSAGAPFIRYLPSEYDDGISVPRGDLLNNLPTPRQVSFAVSSAPNPEPTHQVSLMVMQWGQFVDHDFALTDEVEDDNCCEEGIPNQSDNPECRELDVTGDPFYSQFGIECLHFVRSEAADEACVSGEAREQFSSLTAYVDASQVYGSSQEEQDELRTFVDGQLKVGPDVEDFVGTCPSTCPFTFLPRRLDDDGEEEIFGGDARVDEQPGLTSMHTLFLRAHNDIASQLQLKHGSYSDEELFQETRRIVSALIEHITYNEFLPVILGSDAMDKYDLYPKTNGYIDYDRDISASMPNVFATAAFRFGHSLIKDIFELAAGDVLLSESFENLEVTTVAGRYPSDFLRGIAAAQAEGMDYFMVESLTNLLFAEGPTFDHGSDLLARNIMRARDHGIPPYNEWREFCGERKVSSFARLESFMPTEAVQAYVSAGYSDVNDIDLFPAGIAEYPDPDSDGILGPTFTCIIGKYFHDLKYGDRYFYETDDQPDPFTRNQLDVIRSTYLSSLICAYTNTQELRPYSMLISGGRRNRVRDCSVILRDTLPELVQAYF